MSRKFRDLILSATLICTTFQFSALAQGNKPPDKPGGPPDHVPGPPSNPPQGPPTTPPQGPPSTPPNTPPSQGPNNGQPAAPKPHARISWNVDAALVEKELFENGTAAVEFISSAEVENVAVWLTPSLARLKADPILFEKIEKETPYTITLSLEEKPTRTLGGTLHLRDAGATNRNYANPLPVVVKVQNSETGGSTTSVVSGAAASTNYRAGRISPGETISVFGQGIGPDTPAGPVLDPRGRVSSILEGVQVLLNGLPAPILMASLNQVNFVAPQGLSGETEASLVLVNGSRVSQPLRVNVEERSPAFFSLDGTGRGPAAAINQDGRVNSPSSPARPGAVVTLFGSGFGAWRGNLPDGAVPGSALSALGANVEVKIGGVPATVLYAGAAPGTVLGVVQVNVLLPSNTPAGDKVSVEVKAGPAWSEGLVSISVQ